MKKLNLHASGPEQERLKAYLEESASDALAEKINNGTPYEKDGKQLINKNDLADFMAYATKQAEKMAKEKKKTGSVALCVDGEIIIGWLMHYFEEDDIEGVLYTLDGTPYKPATKPVAKPTAKPTPTVSTPPKPKSPQTSMFDMFDLSTDKKDEAGPEQKEPDTEDESEDPDVEEPEEESTEEVAEEEQEEPTPTEEVTPTVEIPKPKPVSGLYARYVDYQDSYPDTIIAMRIGDFYEVLGDDAVEIAKRLDLTLTSRDVGLENRVPLVGFPYHAAEIYFNKISAIKMVVVVEGDGEVRGYPAPKTSVVEEPEQPKASLAKFDDERFFELLRILDKVEVK
ncbi:MAG: hypothetical protein II896_06430 [Clostridia bacterium]|nr:hypothetical protein [Clostridia bacterium]